MARDRSYEAQRFFDRIRDERRFVDQRAPLVLVREQVAQHVAHRVGGRVVTGERHRVHDVHDVVGRDFVGVLVAVAQHVTGEVVTAIAVAIGDVLLHVLPERDHVVCHPDLIVCREVAVSEEDTPARPGLDLVEVLHWDPEQSEPGPSGQREGEIRDEIGNRLLDQRGHQLGRVLAQLGLERREPSARHAGEHRLAHRPVSGRVGVVERGHAFVALFGEDALGLVDRGPHGRRRALSEEGRAIDEAALDVVVARDDVVAELLVEEDRRLLA